LNLRRADTLSSHLTYNAMAAVAPPATPQRNLPGAYFNTPAPAPSIFSQNAQALRQQPPPGPALTQQSGNTVSTVERAAQTINDTLAAEARFPELDSYVQQGVSGDYDLPKNAAWNPYQPLKWHDLPPRILEQANLGSVAMKLGFFAPLGHAWAAVDNCLYLWDYTMPNPDLIGFEENRHPIETIKLVTPKPGVFVKDITHLIVVSTTAEMLLLGVAPTQTETGAKTLALYNTKMSIPTRGLGVRFIEGSKKSGRIFFSGSFTEDIYEFTYQQEERWFTSKTQSVCHTASGLPFINTGKMAVITQFLGPQQRPSSLVQLAVDDSRNFLYTLSDRNEIKVYLIRDGLSLALSRPYTSLLQNTGHFNTRTELLVGRDVQLVSISPVPATETGKLTLIANTSTGCRLYLSLTRGFGNPSDVSNGPTSMQILHIRFPPSDPNAAPTAPQQSTSATPYNQPAAPGPGAPDTTTRYLDPTLMAYRFPPGYFLAFGPDPDNEGKDRVFCTAPDFARLKNPQDPSQLNTRFSEFGQWLRLNGTMTQVSLMTDEFRASGAPAGFGNEMAVQFDLPDTEIGILTGNGIQTIRRRRLVDIFASLMRHASADDEGLEGDIKRFVRTYGRGETAATALAVACGQGVDVTPDSRVASVTEPDVLQRARSTFIEYGGKPEYNANAAIDGSNPIDSVRPSPRHEGLALYISRLLRSIWSARVVTVQALPGVVSGVGSTINIEKLRNIQRDLTELQRFLETNKNYIDGLAGAQALGRVGSRQEEIALQGEHRAMTGLVSLIAKTIEGISFVLVLFDERVEDILASLPEESRGKVKELTYEALFVTSAGQDLGRELVKAIVNRNIAMGSNVDTVADALRRRCGSFCSADDVIVFKAQEQVKRAVEAGFQSEAGRSLLNESLRLFQRVAGSLTIGEVGENGQEGHVKWAVSHYENMQFYAGAIELCLAVADEKDKSGLALAYLNDEKPDADPRQPSYLVREQCYRFIFSMIQRLDQETRTAADDIEGQHSVASKRRNEAYDVINGSGDVVFQTCLYDWYLETKQEDRLLEITSPFVPQFLRQRANDWNREAADLLWRYFVHNNDYLEAAHTQLHLARGQFPITLEERMTYLSRARTNASTRQSALVESRHSKQQLLSDIDTQLELASIQDDIYQRMKQDPRVTEARRPAILAELNSTILTIDELYNTYADQAGYHDLCILIYQVADHRNPADIRASWQELINQTSREALLHRDLHDSLPWEAVGDKVRNLGRRLQGADATFPVQTLLPMIERYSLEDAARGASKTWAIDIFLDVDIPHESLLPVLEQIYYGNEHPFVGIQRRIIAAHMVYVVKSWLESSSRRGERIPFGSEENAGLCEDLLRGLMAARDSLIGEDRQDAEQLQSSIQRMLR
jgi:nuclear pore complex protein Nup155